MSAHQKKGPELRDCCEPPRGCLELNLEPLEEEAVLLTAKSSLQPIVYKYPPLIYSVSQPVLSSFMHTEVYVEEKRYNCNIYIYLP